MTNDQEKKVTTLSPKIKWVIRLGEVIPFNDGESILGTYSELRVEKVDPAKISEGAYENCLLFESKEKLHRYYDLLSLPTALVYDDEDEDI